MADVDFRGSVMAQCLSFGFSRAGCDGVLFGTHTSAGETRLYTCNSDGFVSAYSVADGGRKLTQLNQVSSEGGDPSYISLDKTGKYIFVANYQGGNIVVFALKPDGSIGERTAFVQHSGKGVDPQRQTHAYAHSIVVEPTNRFILTADLGLDKLFIYKFDARTGDLTPNDLASASVAPGLGSRHVVFHPNGKWVYLDNEMGSKVVVFDWNSATGSLHQVQAVSRLPESFQGSSAAAELRANTKYASPGASVTNRGGLKIPVFLIKMRCREALPCG
jgi:6-phosphogluconolactonase